MSTETATRTVPFFNYRKAFSDRLDEFTQVFQDVVGRGAFIAQKDLAEFEQNLANYLGVKHAVGVGNATDGLVLCLRAAGIQAGDEVLFPTHTMVASPGSVAAIGAIPVPVDIDETGLMDPALLEASITERTRAIMPVQLNGSVCDMDRIMSVAEKHHLLVIEDAAQALGAKYKGKAAGTFGIASSISFYPAKILGCMGDGGAVITDNDDVAKKVRLLRDHGRDEDGEVVCWGLNSRLDNLQAAFLDLQFRDYDDTIVSRRRAIARIYHEELRGVEQVHLPLHPDNQETIFHAYQNFEIEADSRDELRNYLKEQGIGTLIQWGGKAVHQFKALGYGDLKLARAEAFFERCIMLPMNITLSDEDARYVAVTVRKFYNG